MSKRLIYAEDAIDALVRWGKIPDYSDKEKILIGAVIGMLSALPSVQPEKRTEERTETHACDLIDRQAAIDAAECIVEHHSITPYKTIAAAMDHLKRILNGMPSAQPQALIDQLRWERDVAVKQLHDLGYEFGEAVKDAQPEDIARDIATIIENEKDMRVVLNQQRWIPVSEVMPDEHDRVLILTDDGTIFIGDHNEYWEDDYEFEIDDVIAWMPLPEPYKEEQNGKNS